MNLTCAIVDDEPLALDLLESYVNKTPFLTLKGKYSSAQEIFYVLSSKSKAKGSSSTMAQVRFIMLNVKE